MKKQRRVEKDGLIVTHFGGLHTYADAKEALDELLRINKGKKEIYEIVINEDDIELQFSTTEEQLISQKVNSTFEKFERGALAVVAGSDYVFGMTRMVDNDTEENHIAVSVFRTEDSARKWIQNLMAVHDRLLKTDR